MDVGNESPGVSIVLGALFLTILLPLILRQARHAWRRLAGAIGLQPMPGGARRGVVGLLQDLGRELLVMGAWMLAAGLPLLILFLGLVSVWPRVALWHPAGADVLRLLVDEGRIQREFMRGVQEDRLDLTFLTLKLGADPNNPAGDAPLGLARSPEMRDLLLERGAPMEGLETQLPPLRMAMLDRDLARYGALLQAGHRRGLARLPNDTTDPWLALAEVDPRTDWLKLGLAHTELRIAASAPGYGGASLRDALLLERPDHPWRALLKQADVPYSLPLAGAHAVPLQPVHPGAQRILDWLDALGRVSGIDGHPDWEWPGARPTEVEDALDLPLTAPRLLRVHARGHTVLAWVAGRGYGNVYTAVLIVARVPQVEDEVLPAEAPDTVAQIPPAAAWRIAGMWAWPPPVASSWRAAVVN